MGKLDLRMVAQTGATGGDLATWDASTSLWAPAAWAGARVIFLAFRGVSAANSAATNATAISAALTSVPDGTTIVWPAGKIQTNAVLPSFDNSNGITHWCIGSNHFDRDITHLPQCQIEYTGGGTTAVISAKRSYAFTIIGVSVKHSSSSFTGTLVDLTGTVANPTYGATFRDTFLGGVHGVASCRVMDLDGVVEVLLDNTNIGCASIGLRGLVSGGSGFSNSVTMRGGRFVDCAKAVQNPCKQWSFYGTVFEPTAAGDRSVIESSSSSLPVQSVGFFGCGWWDASSTTGYWIDLYGGGVTIDAAFVEQVAGGTFARINTDATLTSFKGFAVIGGHFIGGTLWAKGGTGSLTGVDIRPGWLESCTDPTLTISGITFAGRNVQRDRVTASAGNDTLTLGATPVTNTLLVWKNRALLWPGVEYTLSTNVVSFVAALAASDEITVAYDYFHSTSSAALSSTGGAYVTAVNADSPWAWHRLGDASGTTAVDRQAHDNGTYAGSTVTLGVAGRISGDTAVTFGGGGTGGYVDVPYNATMNTSVFSLEVWVKSSGAAIKDIFMRDDAGSSRIFQLKAAGAGTLRALLFYSGGGIIQYDGNTNTLHNGSWHHIVFTYDGTGNAGVKMYVDGVAQTVTPTTVSGSAGTTLNTSTSIGYRIGASHDAGDTARWGGSMDEAAFYTTVLSAARVTAHYSAA